MGIRCFIQNLTVLHLKKQLAVLFHIGRIHHDDLVDHFQRALLVARLHEGFAQYIQYGDGFFHAACVVKLRGKCAFEQRLIRMFFEHIFKEDDGYIVLVLAFEVGDVILQLVHGFIGLCHAQVEFNKLLARGFVIGRMVRICS